MDWNDVHRLNGTDGLRRAFDEACVSGPRQSSRKIVGVTGAELDRMQFPPLRYIVPGLLPEGLTVLAGRIKLGKSWLTMDWSLAVGFGGCAMGSIECEAGDVLHLALEDNLRRLKRRQSMLLGDREKPKRVEFNVSWPRAGGGGLEEIEAWVESVGCPRLVVIDTLKMMRRDKGKDEDLYSYDYAAAEPFRELANKHSIAVVMVHHLNKRQGVDDPFDLVSGSNGLSACADATLILDRDANGVTLYGRGRDIEEIESALKFDRTTGRWTILGEASEVRRSDERAAIIKVLRESGEPMGPTAIAAAAGMRTENVKVCLHRMAKAGEIEKEARGRYHLPL